MVYIPPSAPWAPSPVGGRRSNFLLGVFIFMLSSTLFAVHAETLSYHPVLWPQNNTLAHPSSEMIATLSDEAEKILKKPIHPVEVLGSAGKTSLDDSQLKESRLGFQDADHAAVL